MSSFQLHGLDPSPFAALFALDDVALAARGILRRRADSDFGFPCRISLEDAAVGDELLLLPYEHHPVHSPYRASGPIYVRPHVRQAVLSAGRVPAYVARRLISFRAYDHAHLMRTAEVAPGEQAGALLEAMLEDPEVACVHLHNARPGCYSCVARRTQDAVLGYP